MKRRNEISPLIVAKYSRSLLIDTVRHFADWNQRNEVSNKIQLKYLFNYLESSNVGAKTILVENEYIDRHFLEDYSKYYSRCFGEFSKKCARIHFFKNSFSEIEFLKKITSSNARFILELQKNYIGYVVIRPIPDTFIAKLCLAPYSNLHSDQHKLIVNKSAISLFGVKLELTSTPFTEQDRVVSECATSAIWTLLNTSISSTKIDCIPSLSTITQIASASNNDGSKTFPSGGLTYKQVANTLKSFDLEPNVIEVNNVNSLKEHLYAYLSNDIPVLLGGEIFKRDKQSGLLTSKGRHFTCVLGFHANSFEVNQVRAHAVDKIYVHDDRLGPFLRVDIPSNSSEPQSAEGYLKINLQEGEPEYLNPEVMVIGLYHKIRISYNSVNSFTLALGYYLLKSTIANNQVLEASDDQEQKAYLNKTNDYLTRLTEGEWEIKLTTNSKLKEELISSSDFYTFNGSVEKSFLLVRSMPKYIWLIRIYSEKQKFSDILIDATSVPQGNLIIGVITYDKDADTIWRFIETQVANRVWASMKVPDGLKPHENNIKPIFKFYSSLDTNQNLNALYGYLGFARRQEKNGEVDEQNNFVRRDDVSTIRNNNESLGTLLSKDIKYIWVIDEPGNIVIGEDKECNGDYEGHPTLTDGNPARIGGELAYDSGIKKWAINLISGSYSSHIDIHSKQANFYLDNVINHKLSSLKPIRKVKVKLQNNSSD